MFLSQNSNDLSENWNFQFERGFAVIFPPFVQFASFASGFSTEEKSLHLKRALLEQFALAEFKFPFLLVDMDK